MNSQIEKLKNELDEAINNSDSNMEDLTKIACNIDKEIEKLYKPKVSQEKMKELLKDTAQSKIIILNIKSDLLDHYYNISIIEMEILSRNIYDYCCLMANDVPTQEIISYITEQNKKYYDQLSEKDRNNMTVDFNIKFFKYLIKKYTTVLKSNKKS